MSEQQKKDPNRADHLLNQIMNEEITKFLKEHQKEIVKRAHKRLKAGK